MPSANGVLMLVVLLGLAPPLRAQPHTPLGRIETVDVTRLRPGSAFAQHLRGGDFAETPARSFADLQRLLTPGDRLVVRDKAGRTTRGRLIYLTTDEVQIRRRRWNLRTERRTWKEAAVQRIQHEDSGWNGSVIGAAIGAAAVVTALKLPACNKPDDLRCLPIAGTGVQAGALIGNAVDKSVNRTVYRSPTP